MQLSETPNKGFAVLTRFASGTAWLPPADKVVTRAPGATRAHRAQHGHEVLAAKADIPLSRRHGGRRGERLAPGDGLETAFRYPEGYAPPDVSGAGLSAP